MHQDSVKLDVVSITGSNRWRVYTSEVATYVQQDLNSDSETWAICAEAPHMLRFSHGHLVMVHCRLPFPLPIRPPPAAVHPFDPTHRV